MVSTSGNSGIQVTERQVKDLAHNIGFGEVDCKLFESRINMEQSKNAPKQQGKNRPMS